MKIVVVYESMFGNTKTVAEAIAEGLREASEVKTGTVGRPTPRRPREPQAASAPQGLRFEVAVAP